MRVCMGPKSEGVDGSRVLHGARGLEEGGGVGWGKAPGAQKDDAGSLRLLLLGEVKKNTCFIRSRLAGKFTKLLNCHHWTNFI